MHSLNRRQLIAAEVRAELARQRLTIRQLGAAAGMSYDKTRRKVAAEYPFDTDELDAVARALGVPLESLLGKTAA